MVDSIDVMAELEKVYKTKKKRLMEDEERAKERAEEKKRQLKRPAEEKEAT